VEKAQKESTTEETASVTTFSGFGQKDEMVSARWLIFAVQMTGCGHFVDPGMDSVERARNHELDESALVSGLGAAV
jgi:hypothetical protein